MFIELSLWYTMTEQKDIRWYATPDEGEIFTRSFSQVDGMVIRVRVFQLLRTMDSITDGTKVRKVTVNHKRISMVTAISYDAELCFNLSSEALVTASIFIIELL